jgi:hypothetical protein
VSFDYDDKLGEINVRTTSLGENKPLNLFIVTGQNFTYKCLLYPKAIPSEQIIIKNEDVVSNSDAEVARKTQEFLSNSDHFFTQSHETQNQA